MDTSELTGEKLAEWVARAQGWRIDSEGGYLLCWTTVGVGRSFSQFGYRPDLNWVEAGPIIEREEICIEPHAHFIEENGDTQWRAVIYYNAGESYGVSGPTPLIAAMRAYVASKFGDAVPDEVAP